MDYDVAVTGLSSPPPSAVLTPYRPAVSVRNNGIHNAIASGYLRIYSAGLLIFETEVYSGTLAPGATGTADAVDYWTPPAEGTYIINGYVTTPLDQVEPNNNLAPVTIIVAGGPVPPPPTVPLHAAQHEEGSTDPINVDGLPGVLADPQPAAAHAAQHQAGGDDALNVGSLQGILAQDQPAQVHSNTRHNPIMSTAAELTAHAGSVAVHTAATNLANRALSGDDEGLVPFDQVAHGSEFPLSDRTALCRDRFFRSAKHASIQARATGFSLIPSSGRQQILSMTIPAEWMSDDLHLTIEIAAVLIRAAGAASIVDITCYLDSEYLAGLWVDLNNAVNVAALITGSVLGYPTGKIAGNLAMNGQLLDGSSTAVSYVFPSQGLSNRPIGAATLILAAEFLGNLTDKSLAIGSAIIRSLSPIP